MNPNQARLGQAQLLLNIFLGMGQGAFVGEKLFPRLPVRLSKVLMGRMGKDALRRYDLQRSPGAAVKRVNIKYKGVIYELMQKAVSVPLTEEAIEEVENFNITDYLDLTTQAVGLTRYLLDMDHELDIADQARSDATYPANHVETLTGAAQWSAATGKPVTDIDEARNQIRSQIAKTPNTLILSYAAYSAIKKNPETKSYLSANQQGAATLEQLKQILEVDNIFVGDGIWVDESDVNHDIWGNDAVLAYVPQVDFSSGRPGSDQELLLGMPAFGFTHVKEGHPEVKPPRYDGDYLSYIFTSKFERNANVTTAAAGFLIKNTAG